MTHETLTLNTIHITVQNSIETRRYCKRFKFRGAKTRGFLDGDLKWLFLLREF